MAMNEAVLITSDRFVDHATPDGHPERSARAEVMTTVAKRWRDQGGLIQLPEQVTTDALLRVHDESYVATIGETAGRRARLDPDTYTSPDSEQVARLAAGAAVSAVDHAINHDAPALAFVRPPGHHAERERAMGFCLYNNVAVAAAHAIDLGLTKVAIVDYDVHHGNGTQWIFYAEAKVLYISTHQYPFYPGTGAADEVGEGPAAGFTVNVPLEAGAGDADYDLVFRSVVVPVLTSFEPKLVLLSAGYDAHEWDPLGGMRVSTAGYTTMTKRLRAMTDAVCGGRLAVVTEGGYDLAALESCLTETLAVSSDVPQAAVPDIAGPTATAERAIEAVRRAQGQFWPTL